MRCGKDMLQLPARTFSRWIVISWRFCLNSGTCSTRLQRATRGLGSRFSHESLLINYPFFKILCNRGFHLLANLFLPLHVRDTSNNLKLYKAEILRSIDIEENHFAANVETGLKPLLAGYNIKEVPISWINRTIDMGRSSFRIVSVSPDYFRTLIRAVFRRNHKRVARRDAQGAAAR